MIGQNHQRAALSNVSRWRIVGDGCTFILLKDSISVYGSPSATCDNEPIGRVSVKGDYFSIRSSTYDGCGLIAVLDSETEKVTLIKFFPKDDDNRAILLERHQYWNWDFFPARGQKPNKILFTDDGRFLILKYDDGFYLSLAPRGDGVFSGVWHTLEHPIKYVLSAGNGRLATLTDDGILQFIDYDENNHVHYHHPISLRTGHIGGVAYSGNDDIVYVLTETILYEVDVPSRGNEGFVREVSLESPGLTILKGKEGVSVFISASETGTIKFLKLNGRYNKDRQSFSAAIWIVVFIAMIIIVFLLFLILFISGIAKNFD